MYFYLNLAYFACSQLDYVVQELTTLRGRLHL